MTIITWFSKLYNVSIIWKNCKSIDAIRNNEMWSSSWKVKLAVPDFLNAFILAENLLMIETQRQYLYQCKIVTVNTQALLFSLHFRKYYFFFQNKIIFHSFLKRSAFFTLYHKPYFKMTQFDGKNVNMIFENLL